MIRELLPPETGLAFEAMRALRSDFSDEQSFVQQVDQVQRAEGYRLHGREFEKLAYEAALRGLDKQEGLLAAERMRRPSAAVDSPRLPTIGVDLGSAAH